MGRKGTEVAKESADIIITDDNFASIVSGIREVRVAYANIRKVIFMLMSQAPQNCCSFCWQSPSARLCPFFPCNCSGSTL
jgi:magnesium-transporting ATPase (P-type)